MSSDELLIDELRRRLRRDWRVHLAVLYGSFARGQARRDSDVDLLVALHDGAAADAHRRLGRRLTDALGHEVSVALVDRVRVRGPLLLQHALDEGCVLVDRDGRWEAMRADYESIAADAERKFQADRAAAAESLSRLIESD